MRVRAVPLLATVSASSQSVSPCSFALASALAINLVSAQTIPLTATITRITYTISTSGGITLTLSREESGTFSRDAEGDEASHMQVMKNGEFLPGTSLINRRTEGKSYIINDARRQYRVTPWTGGLSAAAELKSRSTAAVTRTIGGIKCVAAPLRDGKTGQTIGKGWISPQYGITVRSETDLLNQQTGQVVGLVVEELSDIQIGVVLDPRAFAIPAGYKEMSGTANRSQLDRMHVASRGPTLAHAKWGLAYGLFQHLAPNLRGTSSNQRNTRWTMCRQHTPFDIRTGTEAVEGRSATAQTEGGLKIMVARCVTMHVKPKMAAEFKQTVETAVLPVLRRQPGFQDELVLIAPDGREAIGISLWDGLRNAEAYAEQSYVDVRQLLSTVTDRTPIVQTYEVAIATFEKKATKGGTGGSA